MSSWPGWATITAAFPLMFIAPRNRMLRYSNGECSGSAACPDRHHRPDRPRWDGSLHARPGARTSPRRRLPIIYTTSPGAAAEELRKATIPIVTQIDAAGAAPDVIHGHHH